MKIGNIVSTTKLKVPEEFNVVSNINEVIDGIPTLIVGWEYVHENFPQYDITERKISDNLYWTFKMGEKRDKHEADIQWFISKSYSELVSGIHYVFVDPIQYDLARLRKIISKIKSLKNPISYMNKDMIYIYGEKLIFGVDLKLLKYMGLNTDKIKDKIKKISNKFIVESDENMLQNYKQHIEGLNNDIKFLPYIYTLKHLG